MSELQAINSARVEQFAAILPAWLIGFLSGFFISIPVGPINSTIMHEGARRGFSYALFIGLGSALMELLYCLLGFAGFSHLFDTRIARAILELISFLMMFYLGVKYIVIASLPTTTKTVEKFEGRLHPHHAFTIGFVRTLGNPGVLLFWIAASATFISHEWVDNNWKEKWECIAGVAGGCVAWFSVLSFAVSRGHGRFSTRTLMWMSHVSGATLLIAALVIGYQLVKLLAHR